MRYLVDGYNYLHRARLFDARDLEGGRRRLERRLAPLRRSGDQVTLVWDSKGGGAAARGAPPRESGRDVEHLFPRGRKTADEVILDWIRRAEDPGALCVVSDDGDIARPAKQLGARVRSVASVERELARISGEVPGGPRGRAGGPRARRGGEARGGGGQEEADEKPPPPSRAEVDEWLRAFGEGPGGAPGEEGETG